MPTFRKLVYFLGDNSFQGTPLTPVTAAHVELHPTTIQQACSKCQIISGEVLNTTYKSSKNRPVVRLDRLSLLVPRDEPQRNTSGSNQRKDDVNHQTGNDRMSGRHDLIWSVLLTLKDIEPNVDESGDREPEM
jgi:hypothetical protein